MGRQGVDIPSELGDMEVDMLTVETDMIIEPSSDAKKDSPTADDAKSKESSLSEVLAEDEPTIELSNERNTVSKKRSTENELVIELRKICEQLKTGNRKTNRKERRKMRTAKKLSERILNINPRNREVQIKLQKIDEELSVIEERVRNKYHEERQKRNELNQQKQRQQQQHQQQQKQKQKQHKSEGRHTSRSQQFSTTSTSTSRSTTSSSSRSSDHTTTRRMAYRGGAVQASRITRDHV